MIADTFTAWNSSTHPIVKLEDDWNNLLDHGLMSPYTYLFCTDGTYYKAINGNTGKLVYGGSGNVGGMSGTSCHTVLNAAIQAAGQGGKIFVKTGDYTLTDSVVDNIGVMIEGEHAAGDLFFSDDSVHGGYSTKNGVLFIDGSALGIDMFKIGYKLSGAANTLTFGPRLKNLSFSAYATPPAAADYDHTLLGCGVKCSNIQCAKFENLAFYHKQYGLYVTSTNDEVPLNYSDVMMYDYLIFAFCKYGLYITGAGGDSRISNIWSYINHYNGVYVANYYDIQLHNVMSVADGWDSATPGDGASVRITCNYGDAHLRDIVIVGYNANTEKTYTGLTIAPSAFKAHGKIFVDNVVVQGTDSSGIQIESGGLAGTSVYLNNIYVGSPDTENVFGGAANSGDVGGAVVYNDSGVTTKVYVNGGYADCEQATKWNAWFVDVWSVKNVENVNPFGLCGGGISFIDDTNNYIGMSFDAAAIIPTASTDYTVNGVDLFISSTDSGNADNAIIIKDPAGNVITAAAHTLEMKLVPLGYKINWGAFTGAAPTVLVYGV